MYSPYSHTVVALIVNRSIYSVSLITYNYIVRVFTHYPFIYIVEWSGHYKPVNPYSPPLVFPHVIL